MFSVSPSPSIGLFKDVQCLNDRIAGRKNSITFVCVSNKKAEIKLSAT